MHELTVTKESAVAFGAALGNAQAKSVDQFVAVVELKKRLADVYKAAPAGTDAKGNPLTRFEPGFEEPTKVVRLENATFSFLREQFDAAVGAGLFSVGLAEAVVAASEVLKAAKKVEEPK